MNFKSTDQSFETILDFLNMAELENNNLREVLIIFATDDYEGCTWPNLPGVRKEAKQLLHIFEQTTLPIRLCKNWKSRNMRMLLKIVRVDLREKLDRVAVGLLGHGTDYGPNEMIVDSNGQMLHLQIFFEALRPYDRLIFSNHCRNRIGKSKPGTLRPDDPDYLKEYGKCAATFWKVPQGCPSDDGDMKLVNEFSKALLENLQGSADLITILRTVFGKINGDWRLPSGVGWWTIERTTPYFSRSNSFHPIDLTDDSFNDPPTPVNGDSQTALPEYVPGTLVSNAERPAVVSAPFSRDDDVIDLLERSEDTTPRVPVRELEKSYAPRRDAALFLTPYVNLSPNHMRPQTDPVENIQSSRRLIPVGQLLPVRNSRIPAHVESSRDADDGGEEGGSYLDPRRRRIPARMPRRERSRSQSPTSFLDGDEQMTNQQIKAPGRKRPSERALTEEEIADHINRKQTGPYVLHPISGKICCTFCIKTWPLNQNSNRVQHERTHLKLKRKRNRRNRKKRHAFCTVCNWGPSLFNGASLWHKKHQGDVDCEDLQKKRGINLTKNNVKQYVRIINS